MLGSMSDLLERFLDRVMDRAGHPDASAVERGVRATLRTLGGHLGGVPPALHDALPRSLRPELAAGDEDDALRPAELYQRLADRTGLRVGVTLEIVQSTLAELTEQLDEAAVGLLRRLLPPAWAALLPERREPSRATAATAATTGHTLASGRPGGSRPLFEAPPPVGQADAIATSDDPHGDRLATAHGPGPRDEARTLAEGRPGSRRAVADSS
jgi:uncharacterized protein (DUF2267 family)